MESSGKSLDQILNVPLTLVDRRTGLATILGTIPSHVEAYGLPLAIPEHVQVLNRSLAQVSEV